MREPFKSELAMHAAAYFVPPFTHAPNMHVPSRDDLQGARFMSVASSLDGRESMRHRVSKLLLVAVLHAGLFGWLANVEPSTRENQTPVRLDVRTIEISLASAPAAVSISNAAAPVADRQPIERQKKPAPMKRAKVRPVPEAAASHFAVSAPAPQATTTDKPEETFTAAASTANAAASTASTTTSAAVGASTSSAAIYDADYLRNPAPEYPSASRRSREQGKVRLDVTVTPEGRAADIRIRQSSGYARLDEAALATVRSWRFVPAQRGNEAVTAQVIVPIEFRLAD